MIKEKRVHMETKNVTTWSKERQRHNMMLQQTWKETHGIENQRKRDIKKEDKKTKQLFFLLKW